MLACCAGDHPRMRGEHGYACLLVLRKWGSSPHARGTLRRPRMRWRRHGIIPACAGNTRLIAGTKGRNKDHPRMRGEHQITNVLLDNLPGSSPHARGTPGKHSIKWSGTGIIPACAGNTASEASPKTRSWDHPRMRGEHCQFVINANSQSGSSPHARGTPRVPCACAPRAGIIPACAGNTLPFHH